ncbi:adenylate/guanylate cyclase domain-containing protein [Enterovirga aerilata]|uniref:FHA domain-containing protein n=1 Tax=Enterovirga aerilata TaxID=2730920 RepID=A0A849I8X8_9HYPH|nr:adenylate/guanylate cyclase domain-containing protein [Enterovirga sp. DB1703]NNM72530.1 FHA domain-containing protein [Enterovirga sp. DB1703]
MARDVTRLRVHGELGARQARNVGILFADIAGSMRLYEAFGNRGALAAIEMCLGLISNVVNQNGGFVVKTIGDEIMAAFPEPGATWLAAVEMQRKIDALAPLKGPQGPLQHGLRVGFNFGPAIENNGDFFGTTVNVAARMVQLAKRGQIITTGEGEALLPPNLRFQTRGYDWVAVKGKPDGVPVVEVIWKDPGGRTTVLGTQPAPGIHERMTELRLFLAGRSWIFDSGREAVTLGREPMNDVVLPGSAASRNHATIERRRDRWVLIDHSSNGTFIASPGDNVIHLRREELILSREGRMGFGQPIDVNPAEAASFLVRTEDA